MSNDFDDIIPKDIYGEWWGSAYTNKSSVLMHFLHTRCVPLNDNEYSEL